MYSPTRTIPDEFSSYPLMMESVVVQISLIKAASSLPINYFFVSLLIKKEQKEIRKQTKQKRNKKENSKKKIFHFFFFFIFFSFFSFPFIHPLPPPLPFQCSMVDWLSEKLGFHFPLLFPQSIKPTYLNLNREERPSY